MPITSKQPIEFYLVKGSKINTYPLKRRLLRKGLLNPICYQCGLADSWNGKYLSLQLDHINGISNDNRLENLRILCPNCHSQTDTYAGKHNTKPKRQCQECSNCAVKKKDLCKTCLAIKSRKFNPTKEELQELVWQLPICKISLMLHVSDVAVHRRCALLGVTKPPRGHWNRC